jgi:hypothetical protein
MDNIKKFNQFITENKSFIPNELNDIITTIESYPKKIKINKPYALYDDSLDTAISDSKISNFYKKYKQTQKNYVKSIPFPFDKIGDNKKRFDKLNEIAHIFDKYTDVQLSVVKYLCFQLMDIILYDMYFDIKSRHYDIYEKIDELVVPDKNNDFECRTFGLKLSDRENPLYYIIFYSTSNPIINIINSYY